MFINHGDNVLSHEGIKNLYKLTVSVRNFGHCQINVEFVTDVREFVLI